MTFSRKIFRQIGTPTLLPPNGFPEMARQLFKVAVNDPAYGEAEPMFSNEKSDDRMTNLHIAKMTAAENGCA